MSPLEADEYANLFAWTLSIHLAIKSIRIRTLESEISRLLSENIALREQVIKLQFEIDNNVGAGDIGRVKGILEAKLSELGSLVQELGNVQQIAEDRRAIRRKSGVKASPKKSPDQRNWKNALTISEVTGGADGRLPPIVEGKYYPRRTLDADELVGFLPTSGDPADSPDLGPPPVAHFDAGDAIKFDVNQCEPEACAKPGGEGDFNPALFANLETRRKRRESSQRGEHTMTEAIGMQVDHEAPSSGQLKPGYALKSGAKRKFSAREDGERTIGAKTQEGDEFQYNRNPVAAPPVLMDRANAAPGQSEKQAERKASEGLVGNRDRPREKSKTNTNCVPTDRSVLAPKSVNTDPVSSPVKSRRPAEGEKAGQSNRDVSIKSGERSKLRDQAPSQRFARPAKVSQAAEPKLASHKEPPASRAAPETPAPPPLDIFSPDGSEPRAAHSDSRDTPPPGDLDPEAAHTSSFGSMGRASRRHRGSVSYAEPNLRDKMRRPTKELVDAVAAEERMQQKKHVQGEAEGEGTEPLVTGEAPSKMRTVMVKKEANDEGIPNWKTLPATKIESEQDRLRAEAPSPLGSKAPAVKADLPASVVTDRRKRLSILDRERHTGEIGSQGSGAGSTIAALTTGTAKTNCQDDSKRAAEAHTVTKPADTSDAFGVSEGSPAEANDISAPAKESRPAVTRSSRRHSSISDDRVKDALARRAERRKEAANEAKVGSKTGSALDLKSSRSSATLAGDTGDGAQGRGDRAASRRRSMML
ncbi:MAG: hypothetical protein Q9186_005479 [Xanthomendoza sp. 1 TL-2023]